jgi:hypothetical protein
MLYGMLISESDREEALHDKARAHSLSSHTVQYLCVCPHVWRMCLSLETAVSRSHSHTQAILSERQFNLRIQHNQRLTNTILAMSLTKSSSHVEFDRVLEAPTYFMKGASAATLNEWDTEIPETVRPRSALIKRPGSHPQFVPDTSVRAVEESLFRRTLHDYLTKSNPGAFRKYDCSCCFYFSYIIFSCFDLIRY